MIKQLKALKKLLKELIIFLRTKPCKYGRIHEIQFQGWMVGFNRGLDEGNPEYRRKR